MLIGDAAGRGQGDGRSDFEGRSTVDIKPVHPARAGRVAVCLVMMLGTAALFYYGTGFAPMTVLTWLAPLPVLFMAPRISATAAGAVAFFGYFLGTTNSWGFYLHSHDEPLWLGTLISVGSALLLLITVVLFRGLVLRGRSVLAVFAAPAAWVGLLYLFSRFSPAGIMGTLATTQTDVPLVVQTAAVAGYWGIEFLVLFVPCVLAALIAPAEVRPAARTRTAVVAIVLAGIVLGGGALRLATQHPSGPAQRVALVATNDNDWAPGVTTPAGSALLAGYGQRISALPNGTQLVVLPEGSFTANGNALTTLTRSLGQVAHARQLTIVVGVVQQSAGRTDNLAVTIPPTGEAPVTYLKEHDQTAVQGNRLSFPAFTSTKLGIEICADVDFPNPSRAYAQNGARLVAVPASDNDANGWQHSRTALLRGAENGFSVAWSDRTGSLLLADGFGRVLAQAHTGGPGPFTVVSADVAPGPGSTLYTRFGDWFGWACWGLAFLGLVGACIPAARRGGGSPAPAADRTRLPSLAGDGG
jgi:apolipoprotein N-acyltransferase